MPNISKYLNVFKQSVSLLNTVESFGAVGDGITDDTTAIQNAVNYSYNNNKKLYWGGGTYKTISSITNFHKIIHGGKGNIVRGLDTFYISPTKEQSNKLYIDINSGSSTNDGLTSSEPIDTFANGITTLESWGDFYQGTWELYLAAGTYERGRFDDEGITTANLIRILGEERSLSSGSVWFELGSVSGTFTNGETITGGTSGFTATITTVGTEDYLIATIVSGTPVYNETITGGTSSATGSIDNMSPIPTTIIKEGATEVAFGLKIADSTRIYIKDVKFEDFNGSTSSAGISINHQCRVEAVNCHFVDCYIGISASEFSELDVKGGVFFDCGYLNSTTQGGYGTRCLFNSKYSLGTQNAGNYENSPIFKKNYIGVFAQENCNGHCDYAMIRDNSIGIRLSVLSRLNIDGSQLYRNITGAWATDNSIISPSANTQIGSGTNKNTQNNYITGGGAGVSSNSGLSASGAYFTIERCIMERYDTQNINTTSGTVVIDIDLLQHYFYETYSSLSPAVSFKMVVYGQLNGTTSNKRITHRFGGTNMGQLTFTSSETGDFWAEAKLVLGSGGVTQFGHIRGSRHGGTGTRHSNVQATQDLSSADKTYQFEVQVDNPSDSVDIYAYAIYVSGI